MKRKYSEYPECSEYQEYSPSCYPKYPEYPSYPYYSPLPLPPNYIPPNYLPIPPPSYSQYSVPPIPPPPPPPPPPPEYPQYLSSPNYSSYHQNNHCVPFPQPPFPHNSSTTIRDKRDLNEHYVSTRKRPQNYIICPTPEQVRQSNPNRDAMIRAKEELVRKSATEPVLLSCENLRGNAITKVLNPESRFDVIYVLPPPPDWTPEDVSKLGLGAVAESPSFLFLWSGSSSSSSGEVERGRALLREWGFRRAEDICWVKTNKNTSGVEEPRGGFLVNTVEHCLVGIKGTVVRETDGHIVDSNMDTDVIVSEERPSEEMYRIIEHFCLRQRRLVIFETRKEEEEGTGKGCRPGWVTISK